MNQRLLQDLFSLYLVLAVGYNLVSLLLVARTQKSAAPTDPITGIMLMAVLYLVYVHANPDTRWLRLFFMTCFTVLIFSFGVMRHALNYDEKKYFSRFTWLSAFVINALGVGVLLFIITGSL